MKKIIAKMRAFSKANTVHNDIFTMLSQSASIDFGILSV